MADLAKKTGKTSRGRSERPDTHWKFVIRLFVNSDGEFDAVCVSGNQELGERVGLLLKQLYGEETKSWQRRFKACLKQVPRFVGARISAWRSVRPARLQQSASECLEAIANDASTEGADTRGRLLEYAKTSEFSSLTHGTSRDEIALVGEKLDDRTYARARDAARTLNSFLESESFDVKRDKVLAKEIEGLRARLLAAKSRGTKISDLVTVRAAARKLRVHHRSMLLAIAGGKLETFTLADGRRVVSLNQCRQLWPRGANPMGRPKQS